ncbi:MAG: acetyl-CoA C-acyltransferase, partial [Selenomonadaceae bacterium]|nr:acetyl-CoA C-acyltransferase [Selenomonadaceae bacterium]
GGYRTAQFSPNELNALAMLKGAQRVADAENISKDELDVWAVTSHQRAAKSVDNLRGYIVEVAGVREDTGIKKNISRRLLERAPLPL